METPDDKDRLPPDAPPGPPADRPVEDPSWYHRLNLLAAATLFLLIFCLFWPPTAWIGLGAAVISLGALFFYYYFTRAQLGFVEFIAMILTLGHAIGLTLNVLWPRLRDSDLGWMILAVWILEAAWILCGALWASWVARNIGLARRRQRLYVMLLAWLAVPALPGLFVSVGLCMVGIPTWVIHQVQRQADCIFQWWVLFAPFGVVFCYWVLRTAWAFHDHARRAESAAREKEEKILLPRAFTMNLRESTTPEVLALDEGESGPDEKAGAEAPSEGEPPSEQ